MDVFDAAVRYKKEGRDLIILAGKDYGSGSSRDWAAKGPWMLVKKTTCILRRVGGGKNREGQLICYIQGVKAVIAESYERIHRSNLVGMGVIPLQYLPGETADTHGLTGKEKYSIKVPENLMPGQTIDVEVSKEDTNNFFLILCNLEFYFIVGFKW